MAQNGEWTRKGAVLSDVPAQKENGVTRAFIVEAIQAGALEFREGSVWGNPYLRILRSQLEPYIAAQHGPDYLANKNAQAELRAINQEIAQLRTKLVALEARKAALEHASAKYQVACVAQLGTGVEFLVSGFAEGPLGNAGRSGTVCDDQGNRGRRPKRRRAFHVEMVRLPAPSRCADPACALPWVHAERFGYESRAAGAGVQPARPTKCAQQDERAHRSRSTACAAGLAHQR